MSAYDFAAIAANYAGNFFNDPRENRVKIFDTDGNELFSNIKYLTLAVKQDSKLMEHPVETGAVISDHKVIYPLELEIQALVNPNDLQDIYFNLELSYKDSAFFTIQTKADIYENLVLVSLPHSENSKYANFLLVGARFKQVILAKTQTEFSSSNAADSSTTNRGTQLPEAANDQGYLEQIRDFFIK